MTISDKRKIEAYRESGVPYSEIAESLSLPLNTVKSYCKRHNLGGRRERTADNILLCKQCGEGVTQTPHKKAKIFCSDKCRMLWWQKHPHITSKMTETVCEVCGKKFFSYPSKHRKYCSKKCYGQSCRKENRYDN